MSIFINKTISIFYKEKQINLKIIESPILSIEYESNIVYQNCLLGRLLISAFFFIPYFSICYSIYLAL